MSKVTLCLLSGLLLTLSGCIWIVRDAEVQAVQSAGASADPTVVESPVRAHLLSGRTALFPEGAAFIAQEVSGTGRLYDLDFSNLGPISYLPLDSIAAVETYRTEYNNAQSVGFSLLATEVGVPASALLFKAIFGSCPTVYSEDADGFVLEAESSRTA